MAVNNKYILNNDNKNFNDYCKDDEIDEENCHTTTATIIAYNNVATLFTSTTMTLIAVMTSRTLETTSNSITWTTTAIMMTKTSLPTMTTHRVTKTEKKIKGKARFTVARQRRFPERRTTKKTDHGDGPDSKSSTSRCLRWLKTTGNDRHPKRSTRRFDTT